MEGENFDVCVYRPDMEAESLSFDQTLELKNIGECESIREVDDSQLVGAPDGGGGGVVAVESVVVGDGGGDRSVAETKVVEVMVEESGGGKRKRGRPPRGGGTAKSTPAKTKKEEEDVCFICFDGGSLVLCDRRGCPKAYHPACIKRDEAFFRSTARWNCGWHICSSCQKASHYMCYTCTFSLCKGCTKGADYVCVRGNKGFCTTCLRTIMLIENNEQGNKETTQVDFDDKSSWEYLFKVYWIYLKGKLSLTFNELTTAKNPWKGAASPVCKEQSMEICCVVNDGKGSFSDRPSESPEVNSPKRRKTNEHPEYLNKDSQSTDKSGSEKGAGATAIEFTEWASKELLEFVALMKNGDTSVLSQFDVQSLLLDYIKINNLRDPRRKSQIICDLRLKNLFGKPCVGHFEMLKLIEFHFVIKEESQKGPFQGSIVDAVASQVDGDGNDDNALMMGRDKRRKTRKKAEERGLQINLDEYAAIDVHNINLIYLRRILMESLIEDTQNFHDKVVGSIVRIRISSKDQKQDIYRLVQVVGTSKVAVPYSIGKKIADVTLEILNLDKKEAVSIDAISNQDFSEDECRRLRQSIKCGLVKRFTVGDIQKKAIALQAVRLNDWLETEILRLNHLRDRASEKGHKKELRECVEKLQLLKTPEERQRRLREIPEVHADSRMDPNYESEDDIGELDIKKQDEYARPKYYGFIRKDKELNAPRKGGDTSNDSRGRGSKNLVNREQSKNISSTFNPVKVEGPIWNERKDARASERLEKPGNQVDSTGSVIGSWNNQADLRSVSETSTAPISNEAAPSTDDSETEKLWHYRDPRGKVQGPFCMVQLRKWSTTGYFPPDMRIWGNDNQDDSILLTDVLNGQFHRASDGRLYNSDVKWSVSRNTAGIDGSVNNEVLHSSQSGDSFKSTSSRSDQPQVNNQLPSSAFSGDRLNKVNSDSHVTSACQTTGGQSHENSSNSQGHLGQSSGQNWRLLPVNFSSNNGESSSSVASVANQTDTIEQNRETDIPDLPSPTPKTDQDSHIPDLPSPTPVPDHHENGQATENRSSVSSDLPVQDSGPSWSSASSLVMGNGTQIPEIADEWGGSSPTPAKTFVSVSSLKPPEMAGDQAATPTSNNDQLTHSSPSLPPSSWQPFVSETIEISTLAEESVSDLLAEVDAMESQCGPASPTSKMNCGSKNDCFGPMEEFSPTHDLGKSDAFSSTRDVQFPSQSAMIAELFGASPVDVLDSVRRSSEQSSTSSEVDGETTKSSNVSVPTSQNMVDMDTTSRAGSEAMDTGSRRVQEPHLGWGGSAQGITNTGLDPQHRHSGERFMGPRDWALQAANSEFNRGKYSLSWQSSLGGGGHPRPSKEQRICKFFESGHCKKGASCDYLHP